MITCNSSLHHQERKPNTPPCNCNILNTHNSSNFPMAFVPRFSYILSPPNLTHNYYNYFNCNNFTFCRQILNNNRKSSNPSISLSFRSIKTTKQSPFSSTITCSATNGSSNSEISSAAKIRSEVLSPFRTVRMFFYLAFIASGTLGGLIATTQLIAALTNSSRAAEVPEILKGLSIDVAAVSLFAFLYTRENNAKNAQLAKLSREESLSKLKLHVDDNKIISVNTLRGIARLVICAGPSSFITEAFKLSEPFTQGLLDRGVLVVPLSTDENLPSFEFDESEEMKEITSKRKRLWQLTPVYVSEWSKWLDEQKKLAGVSPGSPVYLSLRLDGRVRGSGIGYPPWNAFVAQLPPVKGMWTGLLDGFDGRVL